MAHTPSRTFPVPPLNKKTCRANTRVVGALEKRLGLKVRVTGHKQHMHDGEIFIFNHFTRFETAIPPYLLMEETDTPSRTVAHHSLFKVTAPLTTWLHQVGAVPSNLVGLLPFLALEVLRGNKVVIFPEGGMIKDKLVTDEAGHFAIWSESLKAYRKHHRGAAVVALMTDVLKTHIRHLSENGDRKALALWTEEVGVPLADLLARADRPTRLVPGNITFYPIRVGKNVLTAALGQVAPRLPTQALDELVVESNLIFRRTDMDVHFGTPLTPRHLPEDLAQAVHAALLAPQAANAPITTLFALKEGGAHPPLQRWLEREINRLRDAAAARMYSHATLNLNHLTASVIMQLVGQGRMKIPADAFHHLLYLALKRLQVLPGVNLHCSLSWPEFYQGLLDGTAPGFKGFIHTLVRLKLLRAPSARHPEYRFSHALKDELESYETRLFNPVRIHANEAAPVPQMRQAILLAEKDLADLSEDKLATHLWDDELRAAIWARARFNPQEGEASPVGQPFLLTPNRRAGTERIGVLLVHGFVSAPAQVRPLAEFLHQNGYTVLGMRVPGHGTSPNDLARRTRAEWHRAVAANVRILSARCDKVILLGYSMGGALALHHAAHASNPKIAGVISLCAPMVVGIPAMRILWLGEILNAITARLFFWHRKLRHGLIRSYPNERNDYPGLNYTRLPVPGISQLSRLMQEVRRALPRIPMPSLLVQGSADTTASPQGVLRLHNAMGGSRRELYWLPGAGHSLLAQNDPLLWQRILRFIHEVTEEDTTT